MMRKQTRKSANGGRHLSGQTVTHSPDPWDWPICVTCGDCRPVRRRGDRPGAFIVTITQIPLRLSQHAIVYEAFQVNPDRPQSKRYDCPLDDLLAVEHVHQHDGCDWHVDRPSAILTVRDAQWASAEGLGGSGSTGCSTATFNPFSVRQAKPGGMSGPTEESSLGLMEVTTWAKRRQSDGRAVTQVKRLSLVTCNPRGRQRSNTWKATQ